MSLFIYSHSKNGKLMLYIVFKTFNIKIKRNTATCVSQKPF